MVQGNENAEVPTPCEAQLSVLHLARWKKLSSKPYVGGSKTMGEIQSYPQQK
jgi:hypothetical protein